MIDPMRFPVADIADLYAHRWELGYREMKQYMLKNELTLRSKKPEMVRQELWGALLAYNLIRFQIGKMAYSLDSTLPIQLSFSRASAYIIQQLSIMPPLSPGKIPKAVNDMLNMAKSFLLPERGERSCPRIIKSRSKRYPEKKEKRCASALN